MFFDNETVNMEKRWSWYYDKFNEKQKKLEKEFDVLKQNILDESNLEKLMKSGSPNTNEIISLASEVEYNDHALLRSGDQLQSLRALNETLKAVDNTVEKLSDASKLQEIQCYNDVLLRETEINKVVEELKTKLVEAVNDRGKYTSEIENLIKKEEEQDSIKHEFQKDLKQLEKDILLWQDVKHIIINYNRLNDLKETKDKQPQDMEQLEEAKQTLESEKAKVDELIQTVWSRLGANEKTEKALRKAETDCRSHKSKFLLVSGLSKTANGELPGKQKLAFEQYVQASYFNQILVEANKRLRLMTDSRFELLRREEAVDYRSQTGLELDVLDNYTGKIRTVKSLSGGESFKASLSLALGLSDVIQSYAGGGQYYVHR